jgi:PAS domain S-box-containing protein
VGVLLAVIAAAIRLQFLEILGLRAVFLTFYPAVVVAALYGGFSAGLLATAVSAVLADYFWMEPLGRLAITNSADLLSMAVFLASGALISYLAEAAYRAQARAHKAEEHSRLAAEREKAAVELQQSESKYRELVQNANSAIIRWKRDGAIAFFNEYAQKFFGYSAEEIIGKNVNILVPRQESTGGDLSGLFQRIVNHPESYLNNINENVLRDGSLVWMAWTNRPVFDQDGQVLEILAIGSDITERRRAEDETQRLHAAVRQERDTLSALVSSIPDEVWFADAQKKFTLANPSALREFVLGPDSNIDIEEFAASLEVFRPDGSPRPVEEAPPLRSLKGEAVRDLEETVRIPASGELRHRQVSASPVRGSDGNIIGSVSVVRDITERKRADETLRESEARFRALVQASSDVVYRMSPDWGQMYQLRGRDFIADTEEPSNTWLQKYIHPDDQPLVTATINEAIRNKSIFELEHRILRVDGSLGWTFSRAIPLQDQNGEIVEWFGAASDITERKQAEVLLRRQAELLHLSYDAIIVWPLGGGIESWNRGAEELYGYSQEEAMGQFTHDLLKTIHPEPWARIEAKLRERKFWEGEITHRTREGREVIVSARHQLVLGADGVERVLETNRDITRHRQAEEDVRRQHEWLRVTLSSIGDGVIATDASGLITFINPVAETLTGWQIKEAVGLPVQKVFRIINEKTHEPLADIVEHVLREGSIVALANHSTLISVDGREIPIEDSAAPIKDDTGKISGAVLVFHDVTERRRAQETMRASEEHYRSLFDNMLNGYAYCKMHFEQDRPIDFTYLGVNGAFETLTGLRDVVGRKVSEVIPGIRQSDPELLELYGRVALTGIPERFETYVESLGMWFSISAYSPRKEHFVAVFDVITERKRTAEALQLSESRFKLLSETSSRLLASENPQAIVEELCRQVMQHLDCHVFFNFMVDDMMGKLHLNACAGIPEEEARKIEWLDYGVAVCGCAARDGKRIVAEDIFNTPDIRTELVKSYGIQAYACHPLEVQGKIIGTLSFGTKTSTRFPAEDLALMKTVADQVATAMEKLSLIDELRNSRDALELRVRERTAELNSYMAKLERSNQALQDFASIAAHDMREPLRKVMSFGNMLSQKYKDSLAQTGNDYLNRMLHATERMQSLLTGLLDYSRVATAAEPFKEVDLSGLIGEVISDLEVRIVKTGGEVHVGDLPLISADPTQMRQLFQNLIGNALKFHKPGEKPMVNVRLASHTDSGSRIVVEDNGIGFDEQHLDKIFAPFQRLHGRSEYEGAGMGLAICKKIVERHGGSITATSKPGAGSTFIIELP